MTENQYDEKWVREEALNILAKRAETEGWSMKDCLNFIFCRLYDEHCQMSTSALLALCERINFPKTETVEDAGTTFFQGGKL